jgi:glycosyltransferase involved in cell wall biosynthesis
MTLRGWQAGQSSRRALPDCSLIVATYRRPGEIRRLVETVADLEEPPAEVLVVDGSPDGASEAALRACAGERRLPFRLSCVRSQPGLTLQRNIGIDASRGELLFFLDDDCLPQAGYFRIVRDIFRADAGERVGAVAGSIVNEMGLPLDRRWRIRRALGLCPRNLESGRWDPIASSAPRSLVALFAGTRETDILPGCAMSFRRRVLETERFSSFFQGYAQGEDLEISMRVRRRWTILWSGDARVRHEHAAGGRPDSFEKGRMEVRNRFFIWRRHEPDPPLRVRVRFWLDIAYVFAWDLASALRGERRRHLRHAAGVLAGAAGSWSDPPRHEEPPAHREHLVTWEELSTPVEAVR